MPTSADYADSDLARAIAACGAASEAAESELYRRFAPRVRLYGLRHLRDDDAARDLAQHVLLLTIEKLRSGSVRDVEQIASFILGVSRTVATDLKRRERRREQLREAFAPTIAFAPSAADTWRDLDRLEGCMARLPERERTVVLLTFYAERSASDAAKELGTTQGNVRVLRHRAVERLRQCMARHERAS